MILIEYSFYLINKKLAGITILPSSQKSSSERMILFRLNVENVEIIPFEVLLFEILKMMYLILSIIPIEIFLKDDC